MTLYEDLKAKRFSLESRRNKLIKDRDIINAMLNEVEQEIIDIEAIELWNATYKRGNEND